MGTVRRENPRKGRFHRFTGILAFGAIVGGLLFGAGVRTAAAGQVVLVWDANTEAGLSGYKLYSGTASGTYGTPADVGNVTTSTVTGLTDGQTYYFAVTAYDSFGNESGYSNEVSYTVPGAPAITLVGNAVSIANGDTTPSTTDHTDFGSADISDAVVLRAFTIQNTGSAALSLSGAPLVAVSGANAADFTVTADPSTSVAAAGSTTFSVTFDPGATGARSATLSIANSDSTKNPYTFAVQGTGAAAPKVNLVGNAVSIANGDTTPSTTDDTNFGSADVSSATVARTFTIQNTGSAALTLTGTPQIAVSGANAADFTVTADPSTSVAAAGSKTFSVTFDPGATGARNATLSIANSDSTKNPYTFAVQGTGAAAPEINLDGNGNSVFDGDTTPASTDFTDFGGTKLIGGTVARTFTIQNSGSGALTLSGTPLIAVSGTGAADFTITQQPAASVAASGGSTAFQVTFDPSVAGTRSATITVANTDADENPYDFAVQGRGVGAPTAPANVHVVQ